MGDGENGRCSVGIVVEAVIFTPTTLVEMGLLLFVLLWIPGGLPPSSPLSGPFVEVEVGVVLLTDLSSSSLLIRLGELTRIRSGDKTGDEAGGPVLPGVVVVGAM